MTSLLTALGLDPAKQRALFRLRARLTWRQFVRQPGQLAGLIQFLLFFVPVSLALGIGSAVGYWLLPEPWPGELLGAVLVLIWLIWIIAPLLSYRLNEGLDIARLMTFPLRRRDLLAAGVAGSLFDLPGYLTLPIVAAVFVGWTTLPSFPILIIALLIWYVHLILTSQLVLNAIGGLLRSRRFRDLIIVVFSLLGMSCFFISQFFIYLAQRVRELGPETLQTARPLSYLQWTPPGATARAIERAAVGDWLAALIWLVYAALWLLPIAWMWWQVTTSVLIGDRILLGPPRVAKAPVPSLPAAAGQPVTRSTSPFAILFNWIPPAIRQLVIKELLLMWRVPQRRSSLLQSVAMPLFFVVIWGVNPWFADGVRGVAPWLFLTLPVYTLVAVWAATQNMLGWEGPGLSALLLTPVRRRTLLLGKGLGLLVQIVGANAILAAALGLVSQNWWVVPGWITASGVALAGLAVTTPISVRFAYPVNLESTSRNAANSGGGCLTGLVNELVVPTITLLVNTPIIALFVALYWQNLTWIVWPAAFMSLGYGVVVYTLSLPLSERLLLDHEPEVIEATSKPNP